MNEKEFMSQLEENFPVIKKLSYQGISFKTNEDNKLCLVAKYTTEIDQQDCLELSQLFALLATGFENIE